MEKRKVVDLYSIRYKNSMKPIEWTYYTKFYPQKSDAIYALRLDTELNLTEAKAVVEEIFSRVERGEVELCEANTENHVKEYVRESKSSSKRTLKAVGKGVVAVGGLTAYFGIGVIAKLTSKYMKKK